MALIAFAGNSVLCRLALADDLIDASAFTYIRLLSGSITLMLLAFGVNHLNKQNKAQLHYNKLANQAAQPPNLSDNVSNRLSNKPAIYGLLAGINKQHWCSASFLFIYAITFSYAYLSLQTGTGALVLFGSVQLTMIVYSLIKGDKINFYQILGMVLAFSGLAYLVLPQLSTPSLWGFTLMLMAGIAWAFYTLSGKSQPDPLLAARFSFVLTLPIIFVFLLYQMFFHASDWQISPQGIWFAFASGSLTSAIGYFIWFQALRGLNNIQAGVVQLAVPLLAALGGLIFAQELISLSFMIASGLILSGIYLVTKSAN
ncbi:MAG: DMT family transporter [Thalassotalea sp.]